MTAWSITYMWNQKRVELRNSRMVAAGAGGRGNTESLVNRLKISVMRWVRSEDLMYDIIWWLTLYCIINICWENFINFFFLVRVQLHEVMHVLINLTVRILSQCMCISNHIIHFKYMTLSEKCHIPHNYEKVFKVLNNLQLKEE